MNLADIKTPGPIGVFDSGYGGLTILEGIRRLMPQNDYLYLGDNARAPYGSRSFEVVYQFTLQAVTRLFELGCQLVILGCNTASAKALRSIQQLDLPHLAPERRVLGIIRPTVEAIGQYTKNGHIGIFGTPGTIRSQSYDIEIAKLYPDFITTGQECPLWVPLVENREFDNPGADYFVEKYIDRLLHRDPLIDTTLLGCTHYPLLLRKIRKYMPEEVKIVTQGDIVARSLQDYLHRHPEMDARVSKSGRTEYLTTESAEKFSETGSLFLSKPIEATSIAL
ncbi:MAG: glutamate racemase [Bacteroides sp.]|nr:glutamate racemase [Bacteroides sp.]MCM1378784.1 glutamate racemase [Bacteroides sp.]MCM1445401.1 glutamate racemase [Prevotella sp.]